MITDYIETHSGPVVFYLGTFEKRRIEKVISAVREGKLEAVLLSKAEEDVEEGAAGCFVGFHEHYVDFRCTGLGVGLV